MPPPPGRTGKPGPEAEASPAPLPGPGQLSCWLPWALPPGPEHAPGAVPSCQSTNRQGHPFLRAAARAEMGAGGPGGFRLCLCPLCPRAGPLTAVLLIRAVATVLLPVTLGVGLAQAEPVVAAVGVFGAGDDSPCVGSRTWGESQFHWGPSQRPAIQPSAPLTQARPTRHPTVHCPSSPAQGPPRSGRSSLCGRPCVKKAVCVH